MSSPAAATTTKTAADSSALNVMTNFISNVQRRNVLTRERCRTIREYIVQSIGFSILFYCLISIPVFFFFVIKLIVRFLSDLLTMLFSLPLRMLQFFPMKSINYYLFLPLLCFCSIVSFYIAKIVHRNIFHFYQRHAVKRDPAIDNHQMKRYLFLSTWICLLLVQTLFLLVPITRSAGPEHEDTKLSSISAMIQQTAKTLTGKEVIDLHDESSLQKHISKLTANEKKLYPSSSEQTEHLDVKLSSVPHPNSPSTYRSKSNVDTTKNPTDRESDHQHEATHSKSSQLSKDNTKQIREIPRDTSQVKFHRHSPGDDVSCLYAAYTDLNCYDYSNRLNSYRSSPKTHVESLDFYRSHSPFPVYLSILHSNGPKCYQYYPTSSCPIDSNLSFLSTRKSPFHRFGLIICLLTLIIGIIIYKIFPPARPILPHQQTTSIQSDHSSSSLSRQDKSSPKNTNHPLDETTEKQFRFWLEQEHNDGYQNISEACRRVLNHGLSKAYESFTIEVVHFANARVRHVSEDKSDPTLKKLLIHATLDLDHLIFSVVNTMKEQHYSIEIPQLTGQFQIGLIIHDDRYSMEMKFTQVHMERLEIIDPNNMLSSKEKQSIIELLNETICQAIVPCSFPLADNQENVIGESPNVSQTNSLPIFLVEPTPLSQDYHREPSPVISLTSSILPRDAPKEIKRKLLVRIVKAVKLHDVEQPFCILELNQPKQTHQTSIAKNGLNPFWDERFLFECNNKSNQIRLQIFDRKKSNKKHNQHQTDRIYADILIPFAYVTSIVYKQDVHITPQHPDSIIRIEFSTVPDEESVTGTNPVEHRLPSDDIVSLPYHPDVHYASNLSGNNKHDYSQLVTATDGLSTSQTSTLQDDGSQVDKHRTKKSLLCSLKHLTFSRRKQNSQPERSLTPQHNTTIQSNSVPNNSFQEPLLSMAIKESNRIHPTRSFRNLFRSKSKKNTNPINTNNFIIDDLDLQTASTPVSKKRSFFRRNKLLHHKTQTANLSANSLTSYDCSRSDSVRNTPIRANVGHPVTMPKSIVQ